MGAHDARAATSEPLIQQGPKLTAGADVLEPLFGRSVALSADGNTAAIGGSKDEQGSGAVWIFTRSAGTWAQQGAKLTTTEETGIGHFGRTVALSADGNTLLVGGGEDQGGRGSAWVFVRSAGTWTQQGPRLSDDGTGVQAHFGRSVALSADGNTALIGGSRANAGRGGAWVFHRTAATWSEEDKLAAADELGEDHIGASVALSADGDTALLGGGEDEGGHGAVWAFTRTGSDWTQQGAKLTGGEEIGEAHFGYSLALSADGDTALIGGPHDDGDRGAEWVFAREGAGWTQEGGKLAAGGESEFGYASALSADGQTALIGGPRLTERVGTAWLIDRLEGAWTLREAFVGNEAGVRSWFGASVALSADAATALVGAPKDTAKAGAAWVFAGEPSPVIPPLPEVPVGSPGSPVVEEAPAVPARAGVLASLAVVSAPPPVLGVTGNLAPVSGSVRVKLPGSRVYVSVTDVIQVPFGTIVDATHGSVSVTTARLGAGTQTMTFSEGRFQLTQNRSSLVVAKLQGGSYAGCPRRHRRHRARASAARKHSVRKLWASGHGKYSTKGSYASGAVLGTRWLTEDRCDGTLIRVITDKVAVTDLVTHRRHLVTAGHSYLAKAP